MHEYDDAGRLVRSRPEPEWDEQEQTVMLALQRFNAETCPACGGPLALCTDPKNEGKYKTGLPVRCHATTSKMRAAEPYQDQPDYGALMFIPRLEC